MPVEVRDNREDPAIRARVVSWFVGGFLLFVAVAALGLFHFYRSVWAASTMVTRLSTFPVPQLQPNPTEDLAQFRARQNLQLAGYAWVDQGRGIAHIPIQQAMDYIAARGPAALDPLDGDLAARADTAAAATPDGAPRPAASLPASPYGSHP